MNDKIKAVLTVVCALGTLLGIAAAPSVPSPTNSVRMTNKPINAGHSLKGQQ